MNQDFSDIRFPARININFALPDDIVAQVSRVNELFRSSGFDDIDFSEHSDHLPHVTLLMGEVSSASDLEALIQECIAFADGRSAIEYRTGPPYWKKPSLKFLFVDTNPIEVFRDFRIEMFDRISDLISCEFHGGPENPSHITLGYGDSRRIPMASITRSFNPLNGIGKEIRICEAGERGTCHNVIRTISLR